MFADKLVHKEYTAVVMGCVDSDGGEQEITILLQGKPSTTTYQVLEVLHCPSVMTVSSLLRIQPKTGRTHQIRKHLSFIGHPILLEPSTLTPSERRQIKRVGSRQVPGAG